MHIICNCLPTTSGLKHYGVFFSYYFFPRTPWERVCKENPLFSSLFLAAKSNIFLKEARLCLANLHNCCITISWCFASAFSRFFRQAGRPRHKLFDYSFLLKSCEWWKTARLELRVRPRYFLSDGTDFLWLDCRVVIPYLNSLTIITI